MFHTFLTPTPESLATSKYGHRTVQTKESSKMQVIFVYIYI